MKTLNRVLFLLVIISSFASCKKSDNKKTLQQPVIPFVDTVGLLTDRPWNFAVQAMDFNHNGVIDSDEYYDEYPLTVFTFYADGRARTDRVYLNDSTSKKGYWRFLPGNKSSIAFAIDSVDERPMIIHSISDTSLTLMILDAAIYVPWILKR